MKITKWQIRLCKNPECGLRFPVAEGQTSGNRCPVCLGSTRVLLTYSARDEIKSRKRKINPFHFSGLLDNIRSSLNVGSIFRTSEGFGADHLYLCGITATPESANLSKTALGAENNVEWSYHSNSVVLVEQLAGEGYLLWALETNPGAKPVSLMDDSADEARMSKGIVLVVGNEEAGVDPGLLNLCHETFFLPMHGRKNSFNVSVAYAIAVGMMTAQFTKADKK
jgi:23S rRNA (guanosine2251-2'-O)-methyltransferase